MFHRFAALVLASVMALCATIPAQVHTAQREASKDVRGKLFKQVMADFPDVRECVTEENLTVMEVDLNHDGVPEYDVESSGPCVCGMVNCLIWLYRPTTNGYELILDGASGFGLDVLKTSTNGYADVRVEARDNAAVVTQYTYKFDGKQYREGRAMMVHMGTGESKPATRRVQFSRGASSATVQGKVSLGFSDTLLVGARAGQVMTLQLTAARPSVKFMIMTSTTTMLADNKRSWTGKLPETGDYLILVDTDDKTSTYSITVSIK